MWTLPKGPQPAPKYEFLKDGVVSGYFYSLRARSKSTGRDLDGRTTTHISARTYKCTKLSLRQVIWRLGLPDSPTVLTNLRDLIENDPKEKRTLEHALAQLANEEPLSAARNRVSYFKGVMHRGGGITLNVACDNRFRTKHKVIDPVTLRDIRNKMDRDMGLTVDLAAFTGERPKELYEHRIEQFRKLNDNYYAVDSIKFQNKGGLEHYGILPARVAEPTIKRAQDNGWEVILPTWIDQWRKITKSTTVGFGVHLTAKYLRQRYKTIAHDAGMPANHFNFLEGTNPHEGGNAAFYEQEDEAKLLREYDLLLADSLDLTTATPTTRKQTSETLDSGEINRKLDLILNKLGIESQIPPKN
jgi:hypothetical protein